MSTTWLDLQGWAGIKVRCRRDSGFLHFVFWLPVLLSLGVCSLCGGASHPVPVTTHTVVVRAKWNFLKLKLKKGSLLEAFQHLFGDIWWPNLWKEDWIYNFFIMTVHLTEPSWQLLFNVMLKFCHCTFQTRGQNCWWPGCYLATSRASSFPRWLHDDSHYHTYWFTIARTETPKLKQNLMTDH